MRFPRFYWVLPGFTGFCWILLNFTGFYWVLPSFTGFYRVSIGLTGLLTVGWIFTKNDDVFFHQMSPQKREGIERFFGNIFLPAGFPIDGWPINVLEQDVKKKSSSQKIKEHFDGKASEITPSPQRNQRDPSGLIKMAQVDNFFFFVPEFCAEFTEFD